MDDSQALSKLPPEFFDGMQPGWWLLGAVERYVRENPGYAVSIVSPTHGELCGFVPNDWNGQTLYQLTNDEACFCQ
jgi:hypothetical protein